jgi:uncharacterized protein
MFLTCFMKLSSFIIFLSIVISVFGLANYYILIRSLQALPSNFWLKVSYITVFILLATAYFLARGIEKTELTGVHHILYWAGSFWMAALLYLFMAVVFIDIVRLANLGFHFLPDKASVNYLHLKQITFGSSLVLLMFVLIYGSWNASNVKIKTLDLFVSKKAGALKSLNIVMVSDIHLGSLFGKQQVAKMAEQINSLNPDIVFLVGDILDEAQNPIFRNNTGEPLKMLKAPLGIYAVTGNHEYIGGINRAVRYIESLNIKLIRDTMLLVNNSFYLAGREDRDSKRFFNENRKDLNEIIQNVNDQLPIILLDHQPFGLNQAVENGVDLQLSGHTHHGQFWPINYLTKKIYEVSWGYKKKGNTHIYVSCGYGTWGPPIRIGSQPEIVNIKLRFNDKIN